MCFDLGSYFIFMNTIIIVVSVGLGILVIILSERSDDRLIRLSSCIDSALSLVQPIISIVSNIAFLNYGLSTEKIGEEAIVTIQRMFTQILVGQMCALPGLAAFFYFNGSSRLARGIDKATEKRAKKTRSLVMGAMRRLRLLKVEPQYEPAEIVKAAGQLDVTSRENEFGTGVGQIDVTSREAI